MVPDERRTIAVARMPSMLVVSTRTARSRSSEPKSQRNRAKPVASSKSIIRTFISANPNLPNVSSIERWIPPSSTFEETGLSAMNRTNAYLREALTVSSRPPEDSYPLFQLRLFKPKPVLSHDLKWNLRHSTQCCFQWKPL